MCAYRSRMSTCFPSRMMYPTRRASPHPSQPHDPQLTLCSALYLSDTLPTAYNAVKDIAVYPDDQVAIFGAGSIGQMAGFYALGEGASKVIFIDTEPRLSFVASQFPEKHNDKLVLADYKTLSFGVTSKETVVSKLKDLCGGRGPDVAIECVAGEYAKGGCTGWRCSLVLRRMPARS